MSAGNTKTPKVTASAFNGNNKQINSNIFAKIFMILLYHRISHTTNRLFFIAYNLKLNIKQYYTGE